ncbi:MAG TPA: EamA family transporter [Cryomorphaceae bacterium]|jgi:drug/metabolite transporter (DMT)-like permease|nr:EamA family transporter [Cryomorphaceae bacterium]
MSLLRPTDDSPIWVHHLWMHFIVLIWGFTGALGKLIHVEALPLVWHRIALAALCMILFAGLTRRRIVIPPRDLLAPLVLNSAIIVVHWITFYHAIKLSNVSLTLACLSTGPFFTSLLEPLFFKRRILPAEILLGGGVVAGMMLLFGSVEGHQTAILVGLTSSILSALFSVMNGRIVQRMTPLDISFWEMSMGVIMLSLYLASQGELTPSILSPTGTDWVYLIILATFCTAFAFVQSVRIMRYLSPFTVMLTIAMEPVYGILIALFLFGQSEAMTPGFYLGVAMILTMLMGDAFIKRRKRRKAA